MVTLFSLDHLLFGTTRPFHKLIFVMGQDLMKCWLRRCHGWLLRGLSNPLGSASRSSLKKTPVITKLITVEFRSQDILSLQAFKVRPASKAPGLNCSIRCFPVVTLMIISKTWYRDWSYWSEISPGEWVHPPTNKIWSAVSWWIVETNSKTNHKGALEGQGGLPKKSEWALDSAVEGRQVLGKTSKICAKTVPRWPPRLGLQTSYINKWSEMRVIQYTQWKLVSALKSDRERHFLFQRHSISPGFTSADTMSESDLWYHQRYEQCDRKNDKTWA